MSSGKTKSLVVWNVKILTFVSHLITRFPLIFILVLIVVATGIVSPLSITPKNLLSVTKLMAVLGVIGIGETIAILGGGVDLSTGSTMVFSLVVSSGMMRSQNSAIPSTLGVLFLIAVVIGLMNWWVAVKARVEPMIGTLAVSSIVQGVYLIYTKGAPKGGIPPIVRFMGRGNVLDFIPMPVVIWLGLSIGAIFLLHKTRFGRSLHYVGSNPVAAQLSGINTQRTIAISYILSALCSVFAGVLLGGYIGIGTLELNVSDYTFLPLTAVLMGGTTFASGIGGIGGTIVGTFVMGLLSNLLIILRMAKWAKLVMQGVIIGGSLAFYQWRRKKVA
jgi:ribose transport system permease protein